MIYRFWIQSRDEETAGGVETTHYRAQELKEIKIKSMANLRTCSFLKMFIYLKSRKQKWWSSISWFTLWVATTAGVGAGPGQSQEPGAPFMPLTRVVGTLQPSPLPPKLCINGRLDWSWGQELILGTPKWNAGFPNKSLIHYATMSVPRAYFVILKTKGNTALRESECNINKINIFKLDFDRNLDLKYKKYFG